MKLNDEKGFNACIKSIKGSADKLAENIHEAGVFALQQVNQHGNEGFAKRLVEALGKKHDAKRVVKWLCHFGKIGVKAQAIVYRKRKDITEVNFQQWVDKAEAMPYWELNKADLLPENVDYLLMLGSMVKKHIRIENGENTRPAVEKNVSILAEIQAILKKHTPKQEAQTKPTLAIVSA